MNQFFIINAILGKTDILHMLRCHRIAHSYALKHKNDKGKAFRKELRFDVQQTIALVRANIKINKKGNNHD